MESQKNIVEKSTITKAKFSETQTEFKTLQDYLHKSRKTPPTQKAQFPKSTKISKNILLEPDEPPPSSNETSNQWTIFFPPLPPPLNPEEEYQKTR